MHIVPSSLYFLFIIFFFAFFLIAKLSLNQVPLATQIVRQLSSSSSDRSVIGLGTVDVSSLPTIYICLLTMLF